MKLSVLMAAYNEEQWLDKAVLRVLAQHVPGVTEMELLVVDDGSTDKTGRILEDLSRSHPNQIVPISHKKNLGKGAAIQSAVDKMTGDICIIQDADLEYDPLEYPLILEPIISGRADCVYGSRFVGTQAKRVLLFWHYVGNKILTTFSNALTNINLSDMETGFKAFRSDILKSIPIRSRDFGFEPEITAKIARKQCRVYEVGISYNGRSYSQGKKITWVDGLKAIFVILKYYFINDSKKEAS